jgi:hypothetical protein
MFSIPFYTALIVGFPEVCLMLLMGFYLSNIRKLNISKIAFIACIQATITYEVRKFSLVFGIHTIIHIITLSLLVYFILNINFYKAVLSVLIGTVLQGIIQSIMLPSILSLYGINPLNLVQNPKYVTLCFIPIFIVSCLLILIMKKFNISIWDIEK